MNSTNSRSQPASFLQSVFQKRSDRTCAENTTPGLGIHAEGARAVLKISVPHEIRPQFTV